jgi:streptogramin lyase
LKSLKTKREMTKFVHVCALLMLIFCASCVEQGKTDLSKNTIKSETKDIVSSYWPGDTVLQIKKGSNGTILIASLGGVFRYDPKLAVGKSFTNLTSKLGSHRFSDVLEDRKGGLWFATGDAGVYYYPSTERRSDPLRAGFQHFTTREGLADNSVICIYEDKACIIWLGTAGGASRYDPSAPLRAGGISFQNFIMKGEYRWDTFITTFMEDKNGKLWISARGDISIYDPSAALRAGGKTFTKLTNKDNRAYDVYSIVEDKKGNIWLGGWDGLRRYDPSAALRAGGKTFTKFGHNQGYNSIIEDKKGNIWTSGIRNGSWALSRYDQESLYDKEPTVTEIMSGRLRTFSGILEANDGSIWFGNNGGLYRYDGKTIHAF